MLRYGMEARYSDLQVSDKVEKVYFLLTQHNLGYPSVAKPVFVVRMEAKQVYTDEGEGSDWSSQS